MARYYGSPLRSIFKALLPSSIRRETKEKTQRCVIRTQSKEKLRELAAELRSKHAAQAEVLDVLLQADNGILLTELLERAQVSQSPVDSLVKKGVLKLDIVRFDRSPLTDEGTFLPNPKHSLLNKAQHLKKSTAAKIFMCTFFMESPAAEKQKCIFKPLMHV